MNHRLVALVGVSLLGVAGCANTGNASEADAYAIDACNIQISEETGAASFNDSDGLTQAHEITQESVDIWRDRAEQASSAAASDTIYQPLRDSAVTVYEKKSSAVSKWKQASPSLDAFYQVFTQADIDEHNSALSQYKVECSSLSNRLNAES